MKTGRQLHDSLKPMFSDANLAPAITVVNNGCKIHLPEFMKGNPLTGNFASVGTSRTDELIVVIWDYPLELLEPYQQVLRMWALLHDVTLHDHINKAGDL